MRALRTLFILLLLTSCENNAHHRQAEEVHKNAFWIHGHMYKVSSEYALEASTKALEDKNHCAHNLALELVEALKQIETILAAFDDNIITSLEKNFSEEELAQINKFYTSTTMGKFLSSPDGFNELQELLKNPKYKKLESATYIFDDFDYLSQTLTKKENEDYLAFLNSAIGKSFFASGSFSKEIMEAGEQKSLKDMGKWLTAHSLKIVEACKPPKKTK